MKTIITLSAIAILGLASCEKESITKQVTFRVECDQCVVRINNDKQAFPVKEYYFTNIDMLKTDTAKLFAGISVTNGVKMKIKATILVTGKVEAEKIVDDFGAIVSLTTPLNY